MVDASDAFTSIEDDDVPCDRCGAQRALVCCPQDAARLCLPCDVAVHAASSRHERAPLCDGCHAAPASARCNAGAALCDQCARGDPCRHGRRPAGAYTGFPEVAELARILGVQDDETVLAITELHSGTRMQDATVNAGAAAEALLADDGDELLALKDPLIMQTWSELVTRTDHDPLMPPLDNSSIPYDHFSMNTSSRNGAKLELPCPVINMPPRSNSQSSSQALMQEKEPADGNGESRARLPEKRQQAKQRYIDKKKRRRFDKQIMYTSRKATADTRKRVRGRFAKVSTSTSATRTNDNFQDGEQFCVDED